MTADLTIGAEAVGKLIREFPGTHKLFGAHESDMLFALSISGPGWLTLECSGCWMITECKGFGVREVHWFCPCGVKLWALRRMIHHLFETQGLVALVGVTPEGHPNARAARVVNRAVGAEVDEGTYILTRTRFLAYTHAERDQRG